jgi:hypothetical protein
LEYPAAQARRPWATKNRVEAVVGIVSCDCADTGQGKGNASSNATNKAPRVEFKTYSMHALFRRRRTKVRNPQVSGNQAPNERQTGCATCSRSIFCRTSSTNHKSSCEWSAVRGRSYKDSVFALREVPPVVGLVERLQDLRIDRNCNSL